ncbi:sodium:calcium antiporter [Xylanibacillus composti]|uniref:K+-dependent Na+/Ca+ exchanger n=1 Tax=Xylanibacillus composti TaxID=1572762 RepID=A0A8J4H3B2_9BACL|nr:calcium/sodium antiporter [Xylanibacillus composti]MDT9724904.1 sodium:calcium antiporter [Xylanibacillus composti]GIQ68139.1 K+-dependent Na+/Ca+ exchanger [Xylanibacillus composti]
MEYVWLLAGFALLIFGANYFVEGSAKIAAMLRVPPLLIGLTIVAFGTSSPEATVSIIASINGSAGVSLGNVIGSNVFNTTLVIGVTAIILAIQVQGETIRKEIPFTLLSTTILLVLISDIVLQQDEQNMLTRADGLILLLVFTVFMYYIFEAAKNSREEGFVQHQPAAGESWAKHILFSLGGLGGIILGGHLVVQNSTDIALAWGMSETLIGLTIVAIGTSLPELVTSVAAALKKQNEIAVGNIVGSNIMNILFVLGVSAVINPMAVESTIGIDVLFLIVLTALLLVVSRTQYKIGRIEGALLVVLYIGNMVYLVIRG